MTIKPDETEIVGTWNYDGKKVTEDENCRRIHWLRDNYLRRLRADYSGWNVLYQDPEDQRLWEITYDHSGWHGGGPPTLRNLADEAAKLKYGI